MAGKLIEVEVRSVRELTPRVREYTLAAADGGPLPVQEAGAHIELHFDLADGPVVRHYSLLGGLGAQDDGRACYRIAVQHSGRPRGSAHMHAHFALGTRLRIAPPRNNFPLDRRNGKSLLIAGGIGITPIYAMARSLAHRRRPFELLYAGRSRSELAYLDELEQLGAAPLQLHIADERGGAHPDLRALLAAQPEGTTAYVCGPASMIAATHAAAAALGWAPERVRSELFTPATSADDTGFDLELRKTGRTLRVGPHTSILEAMTGAGLHPLHDCGRGECGLCPLRVLEYEGALTHRDRYLSDEEKAEGRALCICVSRVRGPRLVLDA